MAWYVLLGMWIGVVMTTVCLALANISGNWEDDDYEELEKNRRRH